MVGGGKLNAKTPSSKPIEIKATKDESSKHFVVDAEDETDDGNNDEFAYWISYFNVIF